LFAAKTLRTRKKIKEKRKKSTSVLLCASVAKKERASFVTAFLGMTNPVPY
jgi:hypothetical protein